MSELLEQLAKINISGAPFLISFGITWIICGVLWKRVSAYYASFATLFQGMVAFPIALLIMFWIGAFENRPDTGYLNNLIIIIAMSQLLVLPLLIAMFKKKHYFLIPFVFSTVGSVHFLMYTWLYQTISYIIMSILIAFAMAIIYSFDKKNKGISSSEASMACFSTGIILLMNSIYLIITHTL